MENTSFNRFRMKTLFLLIFSSEKCEKRGGDGNCLRDEELPTPELEHANGIFQSSCIFYYPPPSSLALLFIYFFFSFPFAFIIHTSTFAPFRTREVPLFGAEFGAGHGVSGPTLPAPSPPHPNFLPVPAEKIR